MSAVTIKPIAHRHDCCDKRKGDESGLSFVAIVVALVLVSAVVFAPFAIVIALPALLTITYHHAWSLARTTGSTGTFAVLLGIDILLIVFVVGMLFQFVADIVER